MQLTEEQMSQLCHVVMKTMIEKGLKGTTMDLVASRLRISKRTLYEIFESKTDMMISALEKLSKDNAILFEGIIRDSDNMLEALLKIFEFHKQHLTMLNVNFFKDMDRLYHKMRPEYDSRRLTREQLIIDIFLTGVNQGLFRNDLNYNILFKTLEIQMESLKRMEELFPPDTSLVDIYNTIARTFLRGIVTDKGKKILDEKL